MSLTPKGPKNRSSMSFLSPKRRKTTGNLKINGTSSETPASPSLGSPIAERPSATHRPNSQPLIPVAANVNGVGVGNGAGAGGDGNLFYAYARKVRELIPWA
jgi:hypothetical protein